MKNLNLLKCSFIAIAVFIVYGIILGIPQNIAHYTLSDILVIIILLGFLIAIEIKIFIEIKNLRCNFKTEQLIIDVDDTVTSISIKEKTYYEKLAIKLLNAPKMHNTSKKFEVLKDEITFFSILLELLPTTLENKMSLSLERLSNGTINVFTVGSDLGMYLGKIKLQGRKRYMQYQTVIDTQENTESHYVENLTAMNFEEYILKWVEYIEKYQKQDTIKFQAL